MTSLEQWGVPLAVLGMLLLTLFMVAVLNRYQAHQALVSTAVNRLEKGLAGIADALDGLTGVPLSKELRVTLRSEIMARYKKIQRLCRRYPGIADKVREAENAVSAQGVAPQGGVGPIESEQVMRRMVFALDQLSGLIACGDMLQPVPGDVRVVFRRELGERRAEVLARYYLVEASRCERSGQVRRARGKLTTLMQMLRQRGPGTAFVRELHHEAEAALAALTERQLNPDSTTGGIGAV